MSRERTICLAGNPNAGKTTLFNRLTGANHYVGNWAGVTVERKEGHLVHGDTTIHVVDLPGIYSLSPYSLEEKIAREYLLDGRFDYVVNIVDATSLERNLYLSTQLIELGVPTIILLNMMDEAEKRGLTIDADRLSERLGVPVFPIVALKGENLENVLDRIAGGIDATPKIHPLITYDGETEGMLTTIASAIEEMPYPDRKRWTSLMIFEHDEIIRKEVTFNRRLKIDHHNGEKIIHQKYDFIARLIDEIVHHERPIGSTLTDRIDNVLLNKFWGIPIFLGIMGLVFYLTFNIGNIFVDVIDVFFAETLSGWVRDGLSALATAPWLINLIVDGVIGGVGGVLTFVPNIAILFFFISILEDSGYMARVAFIMDQWMTRVGLSGKTFIPMILGFGCNVPAIMATRTLENENDRLLAILINPFMSCGARFPVYVLLSSAFFPENAFLVTFSLYLLGIVVALLAAYVLRHTLFKGEASHFIMEMPSYRLPDPKSLFVHVFERIKGYLIKAGTVIFAASVILWFVLNYNFSGPTAITESFGATIGRGLAPLLRFNGFGTWEAALSLLTGIFAKEIVVANMSILYGISESASAAGIYGALSGQFTALSIYAFMVFVLLYTPCVAVIGVIKRETNSWKWTAFSVLYQLAIAWTLSGVIYQVGSLFTGG
jgi:ferrous iron transport protein B